MSNRSERKAIVRFLDAEQQRFAASKQFDAARVVHEVRMKIRNGAHRPEPPRQISTLPEAEQAEALAKIEVINKRHKAAGTLPTPIPRGAQR